MSPRRLAMLAVLLAAAFTAQLAPGVGGPAADRDLRPEPARLRQPPFQAAGRPLRAHRRAVGRRAAPRLLAGLPNAWLAGARKAHVQPHVAFGDPTTRSSSGPSPVRYRAAFRTFRRRWPSVRVFTPWNEATYHLAPTYRYPRLAARYYGVMKRTCGRCQIVAADVLDLPNLEGWLNKFLRYVPGHPRLWGVHNYRDANHNRPLRHSWTLKLTRMLKGTLWVTESGGIAGLEGAKKKKPAWSYSPARAARSLKHLFALVSDPRVRNRYRRVYVYNFFGSWDRHHHTNRWDSGLIGLNGKPRPAYWDLKGIIRRLG